MHIEFMRKISTDVHACAVRSLQEQIFEAMETLNQQRGAMSRELRQMQDTMHSEGTRTMELIDHIQGRVDEVSLWVQHMLVVRGRSTAQPAR